MPDVKPNRIVGEGGTKKTILSLTFNTRPYRAERSSPHVSCSCQTSSKDLRSMGAAGSSSGDRSMSGEDRLVKIRWSRHTNPPLGTVTTVMGRQEEAAMAAAAAATISSSPEHTPASPASLTGSCSSGSGQEDNPYQTLTDKRIMQ